MDQKGQSEREFFRTTAELTLSFGPDTAAARQAMAMDKELWQAQAAMEAGAREVLDGQRSAESLGPLIKVMRWLDFKVDLVLYHLRSQEMAEHFPRQAATFDLSGTGIGLTGRDLPRAGERILMCLRLPDLPARPIMGAGQVVRVDAADEGNPVAAVRFLEITDEDRERIIRYTFNKQREHLARRAEEEPT